MKEEKLIGLMAIARRLISLYVSIKKYCFTISSQHRFK